MHWKLFFLSAFTMYLGNLFGLLSCGLWSFDSSRFSSSFCTENTHICLVSLALHLWTSGISGSSGFLWLFVVTLLSLFLGSKSGKTAKIETARMSSWFIKVYDLQTGHLVRDCIHFQMHSKWNVWPHFNKPRTSSFFMNESLLKSCLILFGKSEDCTTAGQLVLFCIISLLPAAIIRKISKLLGIMLTGTTFGSVASLTDSLALLSVGGSGIMRLPSLSA